MSGRVRPTLLLRGHFCGFFTDHGFESPAAANTPAPTARLCICLTVPRAPFPPPGLRAPSRSVPQGTGAPAPPPTNRGAASSVHPPGPLTLGFPDAPGLLPGLPARLATLLSRAASSNTPAPPSRLRLCPEHPCPGHHYSVPAQGPITTSVAPSAVWASSPLNSFKTLFYSCVSMKMNIIHARFHN